MTVLRSLTHFSLQRTYGLLALGGVLAGLAGAQVPERLYDGARSVKSQKISLRAWGSGGIAETNELAYQGAQSLRVSSKNYFQGGSMTFGESKDVADQFDDKSSVLRVTFFLTDAGYILGTDARNKNANEANMGMSRVGHAASFNQGKKGDLNVNVAIPFKPKIKKIRLVVSTTDGKKSEIYVPISNSVSAGNGWRNMGVPLQTIAGLERTNKTVESIMLSTDTVATMYIGDVRIVNETTPIGGKIESTPVSLLNVNLNSEVTLTGRGMPGRLRWSTGGISTTEMGSRPTLRDPWPNAASPRRVNST